MVKFRIDEISRRVSAFFDYEDGSGGIYSGSNTAYETRSHGTDHPVRYELDWFEMEPKNVVEAGDEVIRGFIDQGIAS